MKSNQIDWPASWRRCRDEGVWEVGIARSYSSCEREGDLECVTSVAVSVALPGGSEGTAASLSERARNPSIEGSVVATSLLIKRDCRSFQRKQDITEIDLGYLAN